MAALPPFMLIGLDDTVITYGLAYEDAWQQVCADHAPAGLRSTDFSRSLNSTRRSTVPYI